MFIIDYIEVINMTKVVVDAGHGGIVLAQKRGMAIT